MAYFVRRERIHSVPPYVEISTSFREPSWVLLLHNPFVVDVSVAWFSVWTTVDEICYCDSVTSHH